MSDISTAEIREAIDDSVHAASVKAAAFVISDHFGARQGDLAPNTAFTQKRKKRTSNVGQVLVDQDKMIKSTTAEKRGWGEAAVTNPHRLMPLHTFGGAIKFFGKGTKYIPGRDTIRLTCESREDEILKTAQEGLDHVLQKNFKIKVMIG